MGIVLAISVPQLRVWSARHNVKGAGMDLAADMMLARQLALTENNRYYACFDVVNNRYTLIDDNSSDGIDGADCVTPTGDDTIFRTVVFLNSVDFGYSDGAQGTPDNPTVTLSSDADAADGVGFAGNIARFNPNGTASTGYVYINNQYKDTYSIGITNSATGNIQTWRLAPGTTGDWSR